jgi:hypothetical protein
METKKINPLLKETIVFRPIYKGRMIRYAEGKWIDDDGQPDLAFVSLGDGPPFAFGLSLPSSTNVLWTWRDRELTQKLVTGDLQEYIDYGWHTQTVDNSTDDIDFPYNERKQHPNQIAHDAAMNKCCELFHIGNGRGPSLTHQDDESPYWDSGMMWIQRTMEQLRKPENPVCHLCLNDGYGHKLAAAKRRFDDFVSMKIDANERISKAEINLYDAQDELKHYTQRITELREDPLYSKEWEDEESQEPE